MLLGWSRTPIAVAQIARKAKPRGPRALALVELGPDGKARLIPIAIMVGDKFYDAGAYKASPIPMALWSETVYEGQRSGVAQGLFTVSGAARAGDNWFAQGKWQPAGSGPAKPRHLAKKPVLDEDEGPPKLRRQEPEMPQPPPETAPASVASTPPQAPTDGGTTTPGTNSPASPQPASPQNKSADESANPVLATTVNDTDPNRPVLRRGKTEPTPGGTEKAAATAKKASTALPAKTVDKKLGTQLIPAISDADGPEPRPYSYDIKPDEEQKYRKKMLAQASDALQKYIRETTPVRAAPAPSKTAAPKSLARAAKPPQANFEDVEFRTFDLWNTNEPVFVLTAKAHLPQNTSNAPSTADLTYFITLVAKADIYGDLRTLRANLTDSDHLDEFSRLELIDAVDADGDGRGELLFREVSDTGSAWGVYRAGADQLFPLFQGTPSGSNPVAP